MLNELFFKKGEEAKGFFRGYGSFGEVIGKVTRGDRTVCRETEDYRITCRYDVDPYGVFTRNDTFENISGKPLNVRCLKSRFVFNGGEYEVYTQFNGWNNESTGAWQELVSTVSASGASSRTCQDAVPFLALWSSQESRGVAFHLLPNAAWQISVTRAGFISKYSVVVAELGILDYNFDVTLAPGEQIAMPQILCYEFTNKLDMDCWKLHNYMHTRYPRKEMPVIYDTWMYRFDHIDFDNVASQIVPAAEMGVEYFFIDAGWFGASEKWSHCVGDWKENANGRLQGRMLEIAQLVRKAGMKFGIWLEPERAICITNAVRQHPEYYIQGDNSPVAYFLDFANPEARNWMLGIIFDLIEHYGLCYIKNDYNTDMFFDIHHTAFHAYHRGHEEFIRAIREKYPHVYISSCASGGERMDLHSYIQFDSTWPSDNESPYTQLRIYKDTLLRLPPQGFERWVALQSVTEHESFYEPFKSFSDGNTQRLLACADSVWKHVEGVQMSWLKGFFCGGPIGLSFDMNRLSREATAQLKEIISGFKKDRDFWQKAVARILCDTPTVTALQYSDMALSKVVVQMFLHQPKQNVFCLHPVVDAAKTYRLSTGQILTGKEIANEGIAFTNKPWFDNWHECMELVLEEVL